MKGFAFEYYRVDNVEPIHARLRWVDLTELEIDERDADVSLDL